MASSGKTEASQAEPLISIVVPAFREESIISNSIREIRKVLEVIEESWEIIVVDDGSSDETFSKVSALNQDDPRIKGVRFSRNFGKEAALLAGMKKARGAAVVTIDGDLQHPPELIADMVAKWREGWEIVHAVKNSRRDSSLISYVGGEMFNFLMGKIGVDLKGSSDFKLLDRKVVDHYCGLPERSRFFRGLTASLGFRQTKLNFDVQPREDGQSGWRFIGLLSLALNGVTSFSYAPLRICTILGVATLLISFVLILHTLYSKIFGYAVSGFATIEISLLFLSSLIMISLGIIGEYLAKIYEEVKNRPHYLISEEIGF